MKRSSVLALGLTAAFAVGCAGDDDSGDAGAGSGDSSTGVGGGTAPADAGDDAAETVGGAEGGTTAAADTGGTTAADTADDAASSGTVAGGSSDSGSGDDSGSDSGGSDESGGDSTSGGMKIENCEAPGDLVTCDDLGSNPSWYQAIGLGCEGNANEAVPVIGDGFNSPYAGAWSIATRFGTFEEMPSEALWRATEGEQMLVLSSGQAGDPDENGYVEFTTLNNDSNGNPDNKPLPAPMSPQAGSGGAPFTGCDEVNDCSDSLITQWNAGGQGANDLIWFQFGAEVPAGTFGFSFDFAYFSEEFPEYVGTTFNDMFVVWSNSETYTGNLCFIDDQPCTVTALWPTQYQPGDPELADTGFTNDGSTGWFQIKGSAEPHELLQLTFAVFDMGDTAFDTLVLLDRFAWDCEGCTPTEINPCGVVDPT